MRVRSVLVEMSLFQCIVYPFVRVVTIISSFIPSSFYSYKSSLCIL